MRVRLALIAGILALGAAVVATFGLLGSGRDAAAGPPAPPDCIASWNASGAQFGKHLATDPMHSYTAAQVTRIGEDCAVIFPAERLDPEPDAGAQIYGAGGWRGLNEQLELDEVLALQQDAASAVNADLALDGTLEPR